VFGTAVPEDENDQMSENALSLTAMAEALARSGDYRVLRRLIPRTAFTPSIGQATKTGLLVDVETTGLDHRKDEIIELGMVKFDYLPDGRIVGLRDVFASFNEPSGPVPEEIVALTGITDEMIAGHRIDEAAVSAFAADPVIVIAHNAASTESSPSATGRSSNRRPGLVRRRKLNGANTGSKDRDWATF
jgi:DNA polymerase III subunit epsilon